MRPNSKSISFVFLFWWIINQEQVFNLYTFHSSGAFSVLFLSNENEIVTFFPREKSNKTDKTFLNEKEKKV